jgi:hypothetical protein
MNRRRALLGVVASCLSVAGIGTAAAQDPRASMVQKVARSWLELTDRGDALASWNAAGKQFQNQMNSRIWATSLKRMRAPLGAAVERALVSTRFTRKFSAAARDGDYALLEFRVSFANKQYSRETLALEQESDGAWRVIGYTIV